MPKKQSYRVSCSKETTLPIFSQDWWLDAVCGKDNWDVAIVVKGEEIQASMPYYMKRCYGFKILTMPQLTQNLGPWLRSSQVKYSKRLGHEKKLMNALIEQLPQHDYFSQNWHYSNTNWLPFYWKGFKQTTNYTYVLADLRDKDKIWSGLRENIRTDIKKATNRFKLQVRSELGIDEFLEINRKTFDRQGMALPYTVDFAKRLDAACCEHKCRKIFIAEDEQGRRHAGVYIIWDEKSAYYLMGGGDPELRNSGATSLCIWEAIKFASTVTNKFDFEGSMIEPVERLCRGFGAAQHPYFSIKKSPSILLRMALSAKDSLAVLLGRY